MTPVLEKEKNLLFLTISGSRAYGTHHNDSDYDIRGVFYNTPAELFGLQRRESQEFNGDVMLHSLGKFTRLAAGANPNILELLFIDEEYHLFVHDSFKPFLENRGVFLSKKAKHSYSGYAMSQVKKCKSHSTHGTLREQYKVGPENDAYDSKYAMHTCRLALNGLEILENEWLTPSFTGESLEFLKEVRAGNVFANAQEFFKYVEDLDKNMAAVYETSNLRHTPNFDVINNLLITTYRNVYDIRGL